MFSATLLTDGLKEYMTALLTHYGHWVQPERQRVQGPTSKPRWMPLPQLLYAQVIKTIRRWQIQTAFIERVNLSIRQHVAAVGRRVATVCKGEDGLRQQLVLYHVYDNFCLPHASLRIPFVLPEPTNGPGSAKRWQPQTPAMAAGLTDHVWSVREMLLFRVPPWPQPVGV